MTYGKNLPQLAVNTIKMLAADAIEKANSGHPGMPMGAADYSYVLWNQYLKFSPTDPKWPNRDRFVLSAGHGSMLLYSLLHLSGFDISLEDLKNFRQWGSKTPGHPEFGRTPGVETTTGPLGQGAANAIGMAIGSKMMAARFNRPDFSPINHFVYTILGDGDMMEGVCAEAASIAGHLQLGNLIFIYDDNKITIDGETNITFSENVAIRFESYGWHTQAIDGHNHEQIAKALDAARAETKKPSLILARTHIGHGSPNKVDSSKVHGSPLGNDELLATKKALGWPPEPTFLIPNEVKEVFQKRTATLEAEKKKWDEGLSRWREKNPDLSKTWDQFWKKETPEVYSIMLKNLPAMPNATRSISGDLEQIVAKHVPFLVGGSADLNESTKTEVKGSPFVTPESFAGSNLAFGIREHAMGAIQNGLALYGSFIPFGSTFLIFSDYMRPAIRLAGLSHLQCIYVFTHDSVFLGEDGPTHQAVEQLGTLRMIPNVSVVRPADSMECAAAWKIALNNKKGPTAISLTRQKIPVIEREIGFDPQEILKGGYTVYGRTHKNPDAILIGTGSELHLAIGAAKELEKDGKKVRVVSMICTATFDAQSTSYKETVLPGTVKTAAIEAGHPMCWYKYVGKEGLVIGIERFGESAPDNVLAEKFGFTIPQVTKKLKSWLHYF